MVRNEYHSIYKCRLCKEEYASTITTNKAMILNEMTELVYGKVSKIPLFPNLIEVHICSDISYGLADFEGFKLMIK